MTGRRFPHEEDAEVQEVVMNHLLDEHPALLRESDLIREIRVGGDDGAQRDAIERAISELIKAGLLDRLGDYVLPTRPAVHSRTLGGL
jgi:hypothetical protein